MHTIYMILYQVQLGYWISWTTDHLDHWSSWTRCNSAVGRHGPLIIRSIDDWTRRSWAIYRRGPDVAAVLIVMDHWLPGRKSQGVTGWWWWWEGGVIRKKTSSRGSGEEGGGGWGLNLADVSRRVYQTVSAFRRAVILSLSLSRLLFRQSRCLICVQWLVNGIYFYLCFDSEILNMSWKTSSQNHNQWLGCDRC